MAGGLAKAVEPLSLVRALRAAGVRVRAPRLMPVVRVGAVLEAGLGALAVVVPSRPVAVAVALSYAGFTFFVVRALRSGSPLASCGCFGSRDTPPTHVHAAVTALLALGAAGYAGSTTATPPWGAALIAATSALTYLTYLTLAVLPLVTGQARTSR